MLTKKDNEIIREEIMIKAYLSLYVSLKLFSLPMMAMHPNNIQLDVCQARRQYIQELMQQNAQQPSAQQSEKKCVFCDPKVLASNYIVEENKDTDVRKILNKNPHISSFDQGHHFVIMPVSHKEHPNDFSRKELDQQAQAALELNVKLNEGSHTQESFTNWGQKAGQTVPHWHSQLKIYTQPPLSLLEVIESQKNPNIANMQAAFEVIKNKLNSSQATFATGNENFHSSKNCTCCSIKENDQEDEKKLIVARFKHNFVCLSHYPNLPGEVSVVPYRHVPAVAYLSPEEWGENMAISMALLPKLREYASTHIRECDGGNIYTKSLGNQIPLKKQSKYHVHTVVMPRTAVPLTPGFIKGNSSKLDYDPLHFFNYLKEVKPELEKKIIQD